MKPNRGFNATRRRAIFIVAFLTLLFLGGCKDRVDKDDAPRQAQEKPPAWASPDCLSVAPGDVAVNRTACPCPLAAM